MAGCGPSEVGLAQDTGFSFSAFGHLERTGWHPEHSAWSSSQQAILAHLRLKFISLEGWGKSMHLRLGSSGLLLASHHHDIWKEGVQALPHSDPHGRWLHGGGGGRRTLLNSLHFFSK